MEPKILVPLDGSEFAEYALVPAEKIAKAIRYELILFRVIDAPLEHSFAAEPVETQRLAAAHIDEATTYLKGIASRLEGRGIRAKVEVGTGYPHSAILDRAEREDVEFICMSAHGRTGLSRVLMGSIAEKVFHTTSRPVMLVKPETIIRSRSGKGMSAPGARS
ncbi:MAG TPA: universal stress protein [Candidatus Aquicultoraceae bacterium]|nr:universal stress protein [Candidatus Aquicultoraceae bacterium]